MGQVGEPNIEAPMPVARVEKFEYLPGDWPI